MNNQNTALLHQLADIIASTPLLVVMLVAGIVCLRQLSTRPRESWLVMIAIALCLFSRFGLTNIANFVLRSIATIGPARSSIMAVSAIFTGIACVVQASAWCVILYAAFGEGSGPRTKYLVEGDDGED